MMGEPLLVAIAVIFIFLPITVISCMMLLGYGDFFILGYSTLPEEEKAKYDKKAMLRFLGTFMLIIELFLAMIIGGAIKNILWLMIVGIGLFIAVIVAMLMYFNTKGRFKIK